MTGRYKFEADGEGHREMMKGESSDRGSRKSNSLLELGLFFSLSRAGSPPIERVNRKLLLWLCRGCKLAARAPASCAGQRVQTRREMGWLTVVSGLLIAFSPILALFFGYLRQRRRLIIIAIGAAFFFVLGLLSSSLIWWIMVPLRNYAAWSVPINVAGQEGARYLFWFSYDKAHRAGASMGGASGTLALQRLDMIQVALATGVGFAAMHGLVNCVGLLWDARGPGALFTSACGRLSVFYLSPLSTLVVVLAHIFLAVLSFDAYRDQSRSLLGLLYGAHLGLALISALNLTSACGYTLLASFLVLTPLAYFAAKSVWVTTSPLRRRREI